MRNLTARDGASGRVFPMSRAHANILRAFSLWTVFVWVTRIRNIWGDDSRSFGFQAVHTGLAVVSVAFAAACWWIVTQHRGRNAPERTSSVESRDAR